MEVVSYDSAKMLRHTARQPTNSDATTIVPSLATFGGPFGPFFGGAVHFAMPLRIFVMRSAKYLFAAVRATSSASPLGKPALVTLPSFLRIVP